MLHFAGTLVHNRRLRRNIYASKQGGPIGDDATGECQGRRNIFAIRDTELLPSTFSPGFQRGTVILEPSESARMSVPDLAMVSLGEASLPLAFASTVRVLEFRK